MTAEEALHIVLEERRSRTNHLRLADKAKVRMEVGQS